MTDVGLHIDTDFNLETCEIGQVPRLYYTIVWVQYMWGHDRKREPYAHNSLHTKHKYILYGNPYMYWNSMFYPQKTVEYSDMEILR